MQRTAFESIDCSISRTMAILGEPWTALILRDLFIGLTRYDQLHTHLGVSRKVLAQRLNDLQGHGIVVKQPYSSHPPRFDYLLTEKGWQLCDILLAITAFGDTWLTGRAGPPATIRHRACGRRTKAEIRCTACDQPLRAAEVSVTPRRRTSDAAISRSRPARAAQVRPARATSR